MKKHKKQLENSKPETAKSSPAKKTSSPIYIKIEPSTTFKRDFKRISKGPYGLSLDTDLQAVFSALRSGQPLERKYRDHSLGGEWSGWRDCHLHPDLLLVYRVSDETLYLARLGSHSEIFA